MEFGFWGGGVIYLGDFVFDEFGLYLEIINFAGGIFLWMNFVKVLLLELGFNLGKIDGEDGVINDFGSCMFNFCMNIIELVLKGYLNFFCFGNECGI